MINKVIMPKTGQTMETGIVAAWRIKVGDKVKKGDIILEIETDKARLEIESFYTGEVRALLAKEGDEVPIEHVIALIGDKDDKIDPSLLSGQSGGAASGSADTATAAAAPVAAPAGEEAAAGGGKVSPRARKLAEKLGVDLAKVTGSGPGGRVVEKDIEAAAAAGGTAASPSTRPAAPAAKPGEVVPANRLRKITAERMAQSKREIPCFYLTVKADVTNLVERRTKDNAQGGKKLSYNDYLIAAIGTALVKFPNMTGQWTGNGLRLACSVDVGLAISTDEGLVAPVVHGVDRKNVTQISSDTQELINKSRSNKLQPADLEGACITLSNLGMLGIDAFTPIVVPGQGSILGVGRITDQCVPKPEGIMIRKIMNMTLSVDHRVADGAYAADFLAAIVAGIQ